MAITVIKPSDMGTSLSQDIGKGLGSGLNSLIDQYSQKKLIDLLEQKENQKEQKQKQDAYNAFSNAGFSPEDIAVIQQIPREQWYKLLGPALQQDELNKPQPNGMIQGQSPQQGLQNVMGQLPQNAIGQQLSKLMGQQQTQQQGPETMQQQQQSPLKKPSRIQWGAYESPELKSRRGLAETKENNTEQRHIDKMNQKWNEKVDDAADAVSERQGVIDAMKALDERGELDSAEKYSFLKTFSLDYPALLKPGSQEFLKLRTSFLKGLKPIFGGRVAVQAMNNYLSGIPDLMQTKEGRQRLYRDFRLMNEAELAIRNARDSVIEENVGKQPSNLRSLATKRSKPEVDRIYGQLKESFNAPRSYTKGARLQKLPEASSVPQGTRIQKGNTVYIARNNKWQRQAVKGE